MFTGVITSQQRFLDSFERYMFLQSCGFVAEACTASGTYFPHQQLEEKSATSMWDDVKLWVMGT
jgi:hypothetical protein